MLILIRIFYIMFAKEFKYHLRVLLMFIDHLIKSYKYLKRIKINKQTRAILYKSYYNIALLYNKGHCYVTFHKAMFTV